jgi:opacity protein-like surface antigen
MKIRSIVMWLLLGSSAALAQRHEVGLTLGRLGGPTRSSAAGDLQLSSGVGLQANYGYRFLQTRRVAFFGEVHFLANGQRTVASKNAAATRDIATLFVTPGLRIAWTGSRRFLPYAAVGAGYALYEQSYFRLDGASNEAPRFTHRGAFSYGGGIDVPVWRFVGLRLEARDFYTGNPSFNAVPASASQHNVVVGGGFVLSWGSRE